MHSGVLRSVLAACLALWVGVASGREILAVGTSFPGVFERTSSGEYRGLATSVLTIALKSMGHSVRFELYPWARAQRMVEQGQADVLIGPYRNPQRETRFAFASDAFYRDRIVFYRHASHRPHWSGNYQDLKGQRIGVVRGWSYGTDFDAARWQLDLVTVESVENGLRMLSIGRLELLASNQRNTRPMLQELGLNDEVAELAQEIDTQDGYFAFPRLPSHQPLRESFDQTFRQMIDQGRLATLAAYWQVDIPTP
ncbi:transporter substrate-binding domain-containing protein [Pseudomonas sp. GD03944]|uniref:substrate-binding periplasmic protein n=1 Tax=Pseudomonas sp. GD03944 TaxID=2975409 RepID=UPI00244865B8|nr:transporter substrate-binding domain-containing protein [Pseudomonas sp. GD03944]MDH1263037.1 transporter substrate-binding domain-containing protein [Pseudomonas sp. GD03944]